VHVFDDDDLEVFFRERFTLLPTRNEFGLTGQAEMAA
jgi:hypothetical protein